MYQSIPKSPIPLPSNPRAVGNEAMLDFRRSLVSGLVAGSSPEQRLVTEPRMRPARPARWGIWLSCQNVSQRSETNGFRNSLIQHMRRVHGSLLLLIPRGFFLYLALHYLYLFYMLFVIRKANFGNLVPRTSPLASGLFHPQPRSQQRSLGNDVELLGFPFVACPPSLAHVHVHSLLLIILFNV